MTLQTARIVNNSSLGGNGSLSKTDVHNDARCHSPSSAIITIFHYRAGRGIITWAAHLEAPHPGKIPANKILQLQKCFKPERYINFTPHVNGEIRCRLWLNAKFFGIIKNHKMLKIQSISGLGSTPTSRSRQSRCNPIGLTPSFTRKSNPFLVKFRPIEVSFNFYFLIFWGS